MTNSTLLQIDKNEARIGMFIHGFARERCQATLEGAQHAGGDAGGMPVHSHYRAEGLESKGMSEPPKELVAAIFVDDRLADDSAEPRHPLTQPFGHVPAMKRKIGAAGTPRHQIRSSGVS
jgi:hypothetical protein